MKNKKPTVVTRKLAFLLFLLSIFLFPQYAGCGTPSSDFLCETGVNFYNVGRYDDALMEFNKALIIDPVNQTAKSYIDNIFQHETQVRLDKEELALNQAQQEISEAPATRQEAPAILVEKSYSSKINESPQESLTKEAAMNRELARLTKNETQAEESSQLKVAGIKISGETELRLGQTPRDTIWKRANWDLNEKNFRMLSNTALDRRENSYDTRIYDRFRVNLDTDKEEGFGFHSDITVDPWSFTGKSEKVNIVGQGGDTAQIQLKYWSNTGYTVNEKVNTGENGDSFNLPEIKVVNGHIQTPVTFNSAFGNIFSLPEIKIGQQFQPVREFWLDYKQDDLKFRVYPMAYESQAVTFDDPLVLSNNRIWWEDSPWIRGWKPGHFNLAATPTVDFTKGYWDKTLSFFTRDSQGQRLTALRGFYFYFNPSESTSIVTSVASPKNLWQDYSEADNLLSATRLTQALTDKLDLGVTATTRTGYNSDDNNKLDAWNYMLGTDLGYEIVDGIKAQAEVAHSQAKYDLTNSQYQTQAGGFAYYVSLMGRYPLESILHTKNGYNGIQPEETDSSFTKFRVFASRMDDSFDAPLSSYVETRDDEYWGRHLHFRQPFKYYYQGKGQTLTFDDISPYRIGNGIDIGRSVLGLRVESLLWDKTVSNLFDVRNVHSTENKFLENVARDELTWKVNEKLTGKAMGIYNRLPDTQGGIDPFIFDTRTRQFFGNNQILDGEDPSVATGSLGLNYDFFSWLSLNGIWEYTNDISLAYDNFPRGILNTGNNSYIFYENGNKYRDSANFLFGQQFFPLPPYPYYNIFKTGLKFNPTEKMEIYLDYTRNPFEKAGQVDDNMNHMGLEISYLPMQKLNMFFRYSYSRWQDLDALNQGITKLFGHHNFFSELTYHKNKDEDLTVQYGESSRDPYMGGVLDIGWDPYGGSLRTIDTQHIFRMYYSRRF